MTEGQKERGHTPRFCPAQPHFNLINILPWPHFNLINTQNGRATLPSRGKRRNGYFVKLQRGLLNEAISRTIDLVWRTASPPSGLAVRRFPFMDFKTVWQFYRINGDLEIQEGVMLLVNHLCVKRNSQKWRCSWVCRTGGTSCSGPSLSASWWKSGSFNPLSPKPNRKWLRPNPKGFYVCVNEVSRVLIGAETMKRYKVEWGFYGTSVTLGTECVNCALYLRL